MFVKVFATVGCEGVRKGVRKQTRKGVRNIQIIQNMKYKENRPVNVKLNFEM